MIVNPAIIALIGGSLMTVGFAMYACGWGVQIIRHWDLACGSSRQLELERRTHLISTIMAWLLTFEIFSLFLFIYTADHLHPLFVGAMCAAGTLHANDYGYPALVVKMVSVLGCGIWLMVNHCDNQAKDYPLIRYKYRLLMGITALIIVGALLQISYFKRLNVNVITSCCGTLFSSESPSIAGAIAALPPATMRIVFFVIVFLHLRTTIHLLVTGRGGRLLGWASALFFMVAVLSVISFISVYYYALPSHHCPFDLLQAHYHYIGYPLYAAIFITAVSGMGIGVIDRSAWFGSLATLTPASQHRFAWICLAANLATTIIAVYPLIFSDFQLITV